MVKVEVHDPKDLHDLYWQLRVGQEKAHGRDYTLHHNTIKWAALTCRSYVELGVNQGCTLACAVLAGYVFIAGVDRCTAPVEENWKLFERYAEKRMLTHIAIAECDSTSPLDRPCDFLLIDSDHRPEHLRKELEVHSPNVSKFILVHDTEKHHALYRELVLFTAHGKWAIVKHEKRNVGYTLLERVT